MSRPIVILIMAILLLLEPLKPTSSGDRPSHYVRDDRPFGGADPPAALYFASRDRWQEHPDAQLKGWRGVLQLRESGLACHPAYPVKCKISSSQDLIIDGAHRARA